MFQGWLLLQHHRYTQSNQQYCLITRWKKAFINLVLNLMNACSLWDPQLACIDQGKCYCYHIELLSGFSVKSSVISNQAGTIPPITAYPTHNIFLPKPFWHVRKINCHFYFGVCIITTDYQNIQLLNIHILWVENLKLNFIKKTKKKS